MTPGSNDARLLGCTCDPNKNANGLGSVASYVDPARGPEYVVASNCIVHGLTAWRMPHVSSRGEERTITTPITVWERRP